ncbi:MAG: hypothetical protein CFE39_01540 [Comamonadaceae bacterium PBBC2]|nr:MAG: hypothetical protein CFE39_01540 [Comamonadaceae bacterium PBBC2]
MTDHKTPQEKMATFSAGLTSSVSDALHEARPAMNRLADRVNDGLSDLAAKGKDAALDAEHEVHKRALHAQHAAEKLIQHAPIRSVLIAAGTGAVTALAVSWLMHLRKE